MVLLAIKEQLHIKSLQGSSFHLEDSEIANHSDFFKKVNSLDYISRYRLLPIIPGNYFFASYSYRQITRHYVLYSKNIFFKK